MSFGFFSDAALTTRIVSPLSVIQSATSPAPADLVVFFGSPDASRTAKDAASPDVGEITISIIDASPGSGLPASCVKLATSAAGLDAAVPGAALVLGTSLAGGLGNVLSIYIRVFDASGISGVKSDLSPTCSEIGVWV